MFVSSFDSALHGQPLAERLQDESDAQPFHLTWAYEDLSTGETMARAGSEVVLAASIRKVSLLLGALSLVHAGDAGLEDSFVPVRQEHFVESGIFHHFSPGISITLKDALTAMIMVSDNDCTAGVFDMVGVDNLNQYCQDIGLTETIHRESVPRSGSSFESSNVTTAEDTTKLFKMILAGTTDSTVASQLKCSPNECELGLQLLKKNKFNDRLPALLPMGFSVAHKTGTIPSSGVINDAGIVFAPEGDPLFTLAVFTSNAPEELADGTPGRVAAQQTISRLARICYDATYAS